MHPENSGAAARLTALYEAHAPDVFRYAIHITGRREDAEDVVQFVFLRAYGMLESGTELVNPRAWLIKTTKHRSLNLIRDRRESPTAETNLPLAPRYDPDPAEAEALADVRSTLWALPESQHHAFVLRHWSGLSQDEIADVLATTPSAVESLLVRARTTLLQEQRAATTECGDVRRRLVQALAPAAGHVAHIAKCGRCRTAQTRLLRASEFAATFALVPRPYVAHALASVIPGFGTSTVAAGTAATGAGGGAAGGTGGGVGLATASAATKVTVLAKIALAATTAAVALGAAHPVRSAVTSVLLGHPSAHSATRQPAGTGPGSAAGTSGATPPVTSGGSGAGGSGSGGAGNANNPGGGNGKGQGQGNGQGNGNGQGKPAGAGGKGKPKGKPTTAGASGKTHGKSATAGANGNGRAGAAKGKAKQSTGTASKGKGTTSKGKGTASTGKPTATGSSSGTTGQGKGNGKGKG
jgi:RNA polymerase sigma factor (sigma-70 family)